MKYFINMNNIHIISISYAPCNSLASKVSGDGDAEQRCKYKKNLEHGINEPNFHWNAKSFTVCCMVTTHFIISMRYYFITNNSVIHRRSGRSGEGAGRRGKGQQRQENQQQYMCLLGDCILCMYVALYCFIHINSTDYSQRQIVCNLFINMIPIKQSIHSNGHEKSVSDRRSE